ncbi:isoleucine--tRNA ligase [Planctomycetales bacterium ZRK34]|nr:isoleucine--tRNA ligase [Planctomycetales bacterium ZRK34]
MSEQAEKPSYKKTLNLPKTSFSMKANLVQREPEFQKRWDKLDIYQRMRDARTDAPDFILHDGPPYANGPIHLGHLLNKVLKDIVVRSRCMLGFDTPFVPGWDCHGLPIEHKVLKDLGDKAKDMVAPQIRKRCQDDAAKFVKLQGKQMQRLGTVGDYSDPYLTMKPAYEAATLEVFADLVGKGLVYRDLKPVHWSIANKTALAEAELEYEDREDTSVYVLFEIENPQDLPTSLNARPGESLSLMIWTTTPWTLPANLAVAASPGAEYGLYRIERDGNSALVLLAADMADKVFEAGGLAGGGDFLGLATGAELEAAGIKYRHPFIDRVSPLLTADYVTLEDGTGLVHTAPGHGVEDYQTGLRCGLDIYCPVLEDGTFDATAPEWLQGKTVWDGNTLVVDHLRESGHLFLDHQFTHSYPHDWRSKTPVIFRATEQWFIRVDDEKLSLRDKALDVTKSDVQFVPEWGRNRMRGMLESRPDWCISRQRSWGLPIPAFYHAETGEALLTEESVRHMADRIRKDGSDVWFTAEAADLLAGCPGVDNPADYKKGADIFDVWFDSGCSWNAVVRQRGMQFPADLYLEGSDQHRGWFQVSLLPALGVTGQPPFKAILTHGFMVDKFGKKMSKSGGNALAVEELLKDFGADVCRWWVASLNTDNDIKSDLDFFRNAGEEYRKVRNTIRFLLSNLNDFDPAEHRRELTDADAASIDAWAIGELNKLIETMRVGYVSYRFRKVHEAIYNFCNDTLSAVYLAATKDRLYCDAAGSDRRRRTQTVLFDIADALIRMIAPVLVHTADEAYLALHGRDMKDESTVHTEMLPQPLSAPVDAGWSDAMTLREKVLKALEDAKAQRGIDNPLDAGIEAAVPSELFAKIHPMVGELADLCGVSRLSLVENGDTTVAVEDLRNEPRCDRSWKRDGTVKPRSDGGMLTDRDAEAIGVA